MEIVNQEIKPLYRFYKIDKYGRAMFEVNDPTLEKLYKHCQSIDKSVSLFENNGSLIMVISNFSGESLVGEIIKCREYKGAIRFYVEDSWTQH